MTESLDAVRGVVIETLELPASATQLTAESALFGSLPELDSFGVVQLVAALEERFDITIDDDEFGPELFETLGGLSRFVDGKLASA